MNYSIRELVCKDGKKRKAVVNEFGRIVTFEALSVYLVEHIVKNGGEKE